MPAEARVRWLGALDEALYDWPPEEHDALVSDFLRNAPGAIAAGWFARARATAGSGK